MGLIDISSTDGTLRRNIKRYFPAAFAIDFRCNYVIIQDSIFPPVAKLDIAADSDSEGRGFKSLRADHRFSPIPSRKKPVWI